MAVLVADTETAITFSKDLDKMIGPHWLLKVL